jgi:hypothetical protein
LSLLDPYSWALSAPVRTDDERLCRQVVEWVESLLRKESEKLAEAAVARLNAEYREELRTRGTIRLPDPSSLESVEEILKRARASLSEQQRRAIRGRHEAN